VGLLSATDRLNRNDRKAQSYKDTIWGHHKSQLPFYSFFRSFLVSAFVNRDEPVPIRSHCGSLTQKQARITVLTAYHTIIGLPRPSFFIQTLVFSSVPEWIFLL